MRAFVKMRKFVLNNAQLFQRIETVEQKQFENDKQIGQILDALNIGTVKPKQGIFYNGQIFDAYLYVSELIKSAKLSIVLIDNYIDESIFTLFTKRTKGVTVIFYTNSITKQLLLDSQKHNA